MKFYIVQLNRTTLAADSNCTNTNTTIMSSRMLAPNSNYKYDNQPLQIRQSATINTTIVTRTILAADSNYDEDNESSGFFLSQMRVLPLTPGRQETAVEAAATAPTTFVG